MAGIKGRTRRRTIWNGLQLAAVAILLFISWPTSLGGQISYVQVSGKSMLPTYASGDLVITRERSSYKVGENVVYRVPKGDVAAGAQVVHRIIQGNGRDGFVLQGDNNKYADLWRPRHGDVVGRVAIHVPHAGTWVAFVARPINLGILCGTLTIMCLLWPRREETEDRRNSGDRRSGDRRGAEPGPDEEAAAQAPAGEESAAETDEAQPERQRVEEPAPATIESLLSDSRLT